MINVPVILAGAWTFYQNHNQQMNDRNVKMKSSFDYIKVTSTDSSVFC